MSTKTLLVVDDDPDIRQLLEELLSDQAYAVRLAADACSAIDLAQVEPAPDLVLLDIFAAELNMRELVEALHAAWPDRQLPVILLSADLRLRELSASAGAEDCIAKPFDVDELLSRVRQWLGAKQVTGCPA